MALRSLFALPILVIGLAAAGGAASAADSGSLPPEQLLVQSADELAKTRELYMSASVVVSGVRSTVRGDFTAGGSMDTTFLVEGLTVRIRKVGVKVFVRGGYKYWREVGANASMAKRLAGRWVRSPLSEKDARDLVAGSRPQDLGYCLKQQVGTLTAGGTAVVDGKNAIVLVDAGDKPGTTPSKLYIAADGPPLPLRIEVTGPTKPGGPKLDRCASDDDTEVSSGEVSFTYGDRPTITAPKSAVSPGKAPKPKSL